MQQDAGQNKVRTLSGTNVILGLWLIVAPFILSYTGTTAALWNDIILGVAIASLAAVRTFGAFQQRILSWTNAVLGIWLLAAPFVLGYADVLTTLWNDIIVGAVVLGLAVWSAQSSPHQSQQ